MDEYIKREDALDAVLFALVGTGVQSMAIYAIREVPTADVVPKSEVDLYRKQVDELEDELASTYDKLENEKAEVEKEIKNWQELYADTVDKWEKAYEELEIKLENAKTDVAREIFEEIEKNTGFFRVCALNNHDYLCIFRELDELKKKYTENME